MIGRWIRDRARATPDRVAIDYVGPARHLRASSTRARTRSRPRSSSAGLRRGDRVATLTGNTPEHVAVFFACAKAGLDPAAALVAAVAGRSSATSSTTRSRRSSSSRTSTRSSRGDRASRSSGSMEPRPGRQAPRTWRRRRRRRAAAHLHVRHDRASRRARCSRTRTASGRTSASTSRRESRQDDVVLQVLPQFHVRRLERPAAARVVEGRDASSSSASSTPGARCG